MKNIPKLPRIFFTLAVIATLGACGRFGELEPQFGSKTVPVAYGQEEAERPDELLKPSAQARPSRSVEFLRRSQRREDDEFDLPPGTAPKVDAEKDPQSATADNAGQPGEPKD